jgi:hypothetical protein
MAQNLFDTCVDANSLVAGIEKEEQLITAARRVTPKMFAHSVKSKCLANPQHIVLPEVRQRHQCLHEWLSYAGFEGAGMNACMMERFELRVVCSHL